MVSVHKTLFFYKILRLDLPECWSVKEKMGDIPEWMIVDSLTGEICW